MKPCNMHHGTAESLMIHATVLDTGRRGRTRAVDIGTGIPTIGGAGD